MNLLPIFSCKVVVSDRNHLSPLLVDAYDIEQLKTHGISDKPGHYNERSDCIREFHEIWGMPLKTTTVKIVPSVAEERRNKVDLDPPYKIAFNPWAKGKKFIPP